MDAKGFHAYRDCDALLDRQGLHVKMQIAMWRFSIGNGIAGVFKAGGIVPRLMNATDSKRCVHTRSNRAHFFRSRQLKEARSGVNICCLSWKLSWKLLTHPVRCWARDAVYAFMSGACN